MLLTVTIFGTWPKLDRVVLCIEVDKIAEVTIHLTFPNELLKTGLLTCRMMIEMCITSLINDENKTFTTADCFPTSVTWPLRRAIKTPKSLGLFCSQIYTTALGLFNKTRAQRAHTLLTQCMPIIFMTHRSFSVIISSHIGNPSEFASVMTDVLM